MLNDKIHTLFIFISLLSMSSTSSAIEFKPLLGFGADFGGDEIAAFELTNGDKSKVKSHAGVQLYAGIKLTLNNFLETQTNIGWKSGSTEQAKNGEAKFARFPGEALILFKEGRHRIGGGFAYHLSPTFKCEIDNICDSKISMKNSIGYVVEYQFIIPKNEAFNWDVFFGLRYTNVNYALEEEDTTLSASGIGLTIGITQ